MVKALEPRFRCNSLGVRSVYPYLPCSRNRNCIQMALRIIKNKSSGTPSYSQGRSTNSIHLTPTNNYLRKSLGPKYINWILGPLDVRSLRAYRGWVERLQA